MSARQRLPNRRQSEVRNFHHAGHIYTLGISRFPDGRIGEIFISAANPGSELESIARDGAIAASFALQHGADLRGGGPSKSGGIERCQDRGHAGRTPVL
jgi:hypothetical protein